MSRRFALLDDNQRLIEERLLALTRDLPGLVAEQICAAMVIGSVAAGAARDESDIDLILVRRTGEPKRADYDWWDAEVAPGLGPSRGVRFPVQPIVISRQALATSEPNLRHALRSGIVLWDPEGLFRDQSEARA